MFLESLDNNLNKIKRISSKLKKLTTDFNKPHRC